MRRFVLTLIPTALLSLPLPAPQVPVIEDVDTVQVAEAGHLRGRFRERRANRGHHGLFHRAGGNCAGGACR